ncbi:MAG: hypothetical protein A4E32_00463 [Methanomassiliicoccales archaeon PtaU1.Bin124]|nr:MAG: hypothetical protein A4E32_00463 [Methanomassiliicoccales archaeon PtaU1.Bin124]
MDVVIIGAGNIGYTIARTLSKQHRIIVIEGDEDRYNYIVENLDVGAVNANGASPKVLQAVISEDTKLLIAVTAKDETNIFACMVAKQIKPDLITVARVRDMDYIDGGIGNISTYVDHIITPELLLANKMMVIASMSNVIDYEPISAFGVCMAKFIIREKHRNISTIPLKTLPMPSESKVIAIHRAGKVIMPNQEDFLLVGDEVTVLGTPNGLGEFDEMIGKSDMPKDFIIVGGGMLGEMLAGMLENEKKTVKLIEGNEQRCHALAKTLDHTVIINENGADPSVLRSENVNMAHVLFAVSSSEESNLLTCLISKHYGVPKVMAVYSRRDFEDVFDRDEIDVSIGYYHVVANEILNLTAPEFKVMLSLEDFSEEFFSLQVDDQKRLIDLEIQDIDLPDRSIIALVVRGNLLIFPRPDLVIKKGDVVLIYASNQDIKILEKKFNAHIPFSS